MEVDYELTVEDHLAFLRYDRSHPLAKGSWPKGATVSFCTRLLALLAILLSLKIDFIWNSLPLLTCLFIVSVAVVSWSLFTPRWTDPERQTRRFLVDKANQHYLQRRRTSIDAQAISQVMPGRSRSLLWTAVRRIAVTDKYLYIYEGPAAAYIIPRRAFASEQEFEDFTTAAQWYHDAVMGLVQHD